MSGDTIDTGSSVSRQHYIDTGRYLTKLEVAEQAWLDAEDALEREHDHGTPDGVAAAERAERAACARYRAAAREARARRPVGPCPCECNSGGWCGGCGHAGCGGRR